MGAKKKYKKEILKTLKELSFIEHSLLESMTNLMLLKEMKKNKIASKKEILFLSRTIFSTIVQIKMLLK